MEPLDKDLVVGDWPDLTCGDCGRDGVGVQMSGDAVPPLERPMSLCADCADVRNDRFRDFGKAMPTTDAFLASVAGNALKNFSDGEIVFVKRALHLIRSNFQALEKDWRVVFNHGLLTAVRLDGGFQLRFNIHFRTNAVLGLLVQETMDEHGRPVVKEIHKEALPVGDWNAIIGWVSAAKLECRRVGATTFRRVKVVDDFVHEDVSFRPGDWVEVRHDGIGLRKAGDKKWVGDSGTVKAFLENGYFVHEGVDDWAWDPEEENE